MTENRTYNILVANGVNLDLLGRREPDIYGRFSIQNLQDRLLQQAQQFEQVFAAEFSLNFYQSNQEGLFLDKLSEQDWDAILINPGAWTHSSIALADRLKGLAIPYIEIHISNTAKREAFRHQSYTAPHALGVISGLGPLSYEAALFAICKYLTIAP